jgi:major vault protein
MADASQREELILAQNQHAFIQDETKGIVQVLVGPYKTGLTPNDRPVLYDSETGKFKAVMLSQAVQQNPVVKDGSYIVLENPSAEEKKEHPTVGVCGTVGLMEGKKINIPGPITFALWPGQVATILPGHQLRSNEYLIARVYNDAVAKENWKIASPALPAELVTGQLLVIKGTELSFFIPPTGVEVVKEDSGNYVRKAVTLERLEYCILLDEDGNKRYERGPVVVFPEATEVFIHKSSSDQKSVKFKAIELNDQMGLYIKIIADYEEDGTKYVVGDELFITGKQQRIYYPRPEHAIIEYGEGDESFKRQRYYGIAIPEGEARYVLDKDSGKVEMQRGPEIFLPDPRHQVTIRRVLDKRAVELWYPGNAEALQYNTGLASLAVASDGYVENKSYATAMELQRSMNRGTRGSTALVGAGDSIQRGGKFTPPPTLTLNTKYEGVPTINIWTGYAIQVVDKTGNRRVIKGPTSVLLEYDESLEVLTLSTGKPKSTDRLFSTCYLRVMHNVVSDIVSVETQDLVPVDVKVSYRVNFTGDSNKWFNVENYVKYLTDHLRSLLRAVAKHHSIEEFIEKSATIIRDTVLGPHIDGKARAGQMFKENGMHVYDVEVLQVEIKESNIADLLTMARQNTVKQAIQLGSEDKKLELSKKQTAIKLELNQLEHDARMTILELKEQEEQKEHEIRSNQLQAGIAYTLEEVKARTAQQDDLNQVAEAELSRVAAKDVQAGARLRLETENFKDRLTAISPALIAALQSLSDHKLLEQLGAAVAPLAVMEQQGFAQILTRMFKGTPIQDRLSKLLTEESDKPRS